MIDNILYDLDKMKDNMIMLEQETNIIFDPNASYAYNKFMAELGHNIKIAPIYKDDKLIGGIYVRIYKTGSHIRYIIQGGLIFLNGFEEVVSTFVEKNFCCINVRIQYSLNQKLDFKRLHRIKHSPKTVLIPIKETEEAQSKLLVRRRKRDIVKAEKNGLIVRKLVSIDEYMSMFKVLNELATFRSYEQDISMDLLKAYYEKLVPEHIVLALGCFQGENMIAADMILFSKNKAREQIIAERPSKMDTGAQSFLIWHTIEYCRQNNVKFLDLAGVPPEYSYMAGIGKFKKSFGGDVLNIQIYEENFVERLKQNIKLSPFALKIQRFYNKHKL